MAETNPALHCYPDGSRISWIWDSAPLKFLSRGIRDAQNNIFLLCQIELKVWNKANMPKTV